MTTFTKYHGDFSYRTMAAIGMIGPILLIIAASTLPEDPETGEFTVYGHGVILAVVAAALALRAAYARGFISPIRASGSARAERDTIADRLRLLEQRERMRPFVAQEARDTPEHA
jgi:hypothetical protein